MNVLFMSMVDELDNMDNHDIYTDLLRRFRDNNHNVFVISPREKRMNLSTEYIRKKGVTFLLVKIGNIRGVGFIEKGISTVTLKGKFLRAAKEYLGDIKFDLIIYPTPPITFQKVVHYIKRRDGARSYLLLKDIFPQNAVDLNIFSKKNPIYWYFRNTEKKLYKNSDYIGCMSKANVDFLLRNNLHVSSDRVEVCPNSVDPSDVKLDLEKINSVKSRYGIPLDKTIFIYGGNLGRPQGIDFLIECLESNKDNKSVHFVISGSGTEFGKIKSFIDRVKPQNVQLINQLSRCEYELVANSSDVGLIFLDKRFTIPNFPSRMLSYMEASIPVLAATDKNTDLGSVINKGEFGYWCESGDIDLFNEKVEKLCDAETRKQMGLNGRKYLEDNYTVEKSYGVIMNHFE